MSSETIQLSKLLPDHIIKEADSMYPRGSQQLAGRMTGKTTGFILSTIGYAMEHPSITVELCSDHHASNKTLAARQVYRTAQQLVELLKLKHFNFFALGGKYYMQYDIFKDHTLPASTRR